MQYPMQKGKGRESILWNFHELGCDAKTDYESRERGIYALCTQEVRKALYTQLNTRRRKATH